MNTGREEALKADAKEAILKQKKIKHELPELISDDDEDEEIAAKVISKIPANLNLPKLIDIFKDLKVEVEDQSESEVEKIKLSNQLGKTYIERKVIDNRAEYNFTVEPDNNNYSHEKYAEYFLAKLELLSKNQGGQLIDLDLEGLASKKGDLKLAIEKLISENKTKYGFINSVNGLPLSEFDSKPDSNENEKLINISDKDLNKEEIRKILNKLINDGYVSITLEDDANPKLIGILKDLMDEEKYKDIEFMFGDKELKESYEEKKLKLNS